MHALKKKGGAPPVNHLPTRGRFWTEITVSVSAPLFLTAAFSGHLPPLFHSYRRGVPLRLNCLPETWEGFPFHWPASFGQACFLTSCSLSFSVSKSKDTLECEFSPINLCIASFAFSSTQASANQTAEAEPEPDADPDQQSRSSTCCHSAGDTIRLEIKTDAPGGRG